MCPSSWVRVLTVRKLGDPAPVDARTLFGIASNTKAFTATALGLLVEEGKIEWDAPVVRYLPAFAMWDPFVTRELTVRDLLVHRSGLGLGAGDLLWWPESTYDRKEIARRLRFIPPATSFRSAYAYDNVLYLIAGELIETISGQTWEDFVSDAHSGEGRDDRQQRAAFRRRRPAATSPRRMRASTAQVRPIRPFDERQHQPGRRHQLIGRGHGEMAARPARRAARSPTARGCSRRATARQLTAIVTPIPIGDPPPELRAAASRTSTATRSASTSATTAATRCVHAHRRAAGLRLARRR